MKRLVAAVGLASMLGPLAVSTGVEAQTLPVPLPTVSAPALPEVLPKPTPTPEPLPLPTSVVLPKPVETLIERVPVPGPVKTVVEKVPGPVETVVERTTTTTPVPGPARTVSVPGPVRTVLVPGPVRTVIRERVVVRQVPGPRVTVTAEPSVSPSPVIVYRDRPGDDIYLSTPEAIGITVGLVALGILLGLVSLWLVYGVGYKDSQRKQEQELSDLSDELFGR